MKRVSKSKILEIINQINDEMLNDKDNPMSIYECFDFNEKYNGEIAKHLSNANSYDEDPLDAMMCVVAYCGSVVPKMILERLFEKKMLLNKQKYISLLNWLEDAWIMYKIRNTPFTIPDLEEYIEKCHHSIVKQKLKDVLKMIYDKNKVNDSIF